MLAFVHITWYPVSSLDKERLAIYLECQILSYFYGANTYFFIECLTISPYTYII